MRKVFFVTMIAAFAAAPAESDGQSISVSAGPTYVFEPASEWSDQGYNVQAGKEFGHFGPAVFRADALYMHRSGNALTRSPITERTYAVAGSVVLRRSIRRVAPFALVGVGLYGDNSWTTYTPGVNAGIGMELSIMYMHFVAESRIHHYWRDARHAPRSGRGVTQVPISFGLRF
jgi:hypothetical protein